MPRLTENIYAQNPGESLLAAIGASSNQMPTTPYAGNYELAHIINAYRTLPDSLEAQTHQATFSTMQAARDFTGGKHVVKFVSVQYPEDRDIVPDDFQKADDLQRSVLDFGTFSVPRKLPLLFDILHNGIETRQDADYIVFTNTDINLMPHFYTCIARILDYGFDVVVVNRREIPDFSADPDLAVLMYSDYGIIHEGFDCFVFPAKMFSQFITNHACTGAGLVMRGLLYNLAAHARKMLILRDCHLTFHLGQERAWQAPELSDYTEYNRLHASKVLNELSANPEKKSRLNMFSGNRRQGAS